MADYVWKDNRLYVGRKFTGYSVEADLFYPTMFRVKRPDRLVSDMANLTRAKDAASLMVARISKAVVAGTDRAPIA